MALVDDPQRKFQQHLDSLYGQKHGERDYKAREQLESLRKCNASCFTVDEVHFVMRHFIGGYGDTPNVEAERIDKLYSRVFGDFASGGK